MAKKHLAVVAITQKEKLYRLNTITTSNDGSIHIISNVSGDDKSPQLKGTYHPSGLGHFTERTKTETEEIFPKWRESHNEVTDSKGLMNFTIKNINTKGVGFLDEATGIGKYRNIIKIKAKKYTHLTIRYFLASKDFDTSKSSHLYAEVFEIELDNGKLLVATESSENVTDLMNIYI
jgi:hypothetical protein